MKKIVSLLLGIVFILAMTTTAYAGEASWSDASGKIAINNSGSGIVIDMPSDSGNYSYGTVSGQTGTNASSLPSEGWTWAVKNESGTQSGIDYSYVLYLNNLEASSNTQDTLLISVNTKVVLMGNNSLTSQNYGSCLSGNFNISFIIDGDGKLNTNGGIGICSMENIQIDGGEVNLTTSGSNGAIRGELSISNGTLIAKNTVSHQVLEKKPTIERSLISSEAKTSLEGETTDYDETYWNYYKYVKLVVGEENNTPTPTPTSTYIPVIKYVYANDGTLLPESKVYLYNESLHQKEVAQIQSDVKDWKVTVRTALAKKGIKLYTYLNGFDTEELFSYLDNGYTVKYDWYKAAGKNKNYKYVDSSDDNYFYDKDVKSGRTYFYKCKITIYDENGQIVKTTLTDCKYGCRKFK